VGLRRGDIAIVAPPGDFSKPRPATILQEEVYPETELVTVALITSD
jgi:mRNA-degrading endonuclease toxin of MazEF toxin-antitoxin module